MKAAIFEHDNNVIPLPRPTSSYISTSLPEQQHISSAPAASLSSSYQTTRQHHGKPSFTPTPTKPYDNTYIYTTIHSATFKMADPF